MSKLPASRWAALTMLVAAAAAFGAGCAHPKPTEAANLGFTLKDMNGKDVRLADFKGKPLIINFWETTCGPCRLETPELVDLAAKYKDQGLTILGISVSDSPDDIKQFAKEFKVNYPLLVGVDRDDVADALGLGDGVPMSVFITTHGTVRGRLEGMATSAFFDKQIHALF
jgi:cytochrome c biogenesis protein CcmG/thiol:disulfide interchange protein DsbE